MYLLFFCCCVIYLKKQKTNVGKMCSKTSWLQLPDGPSCFPGCTSEWPTRLVRWTTTCSTSPVLQNRRLVVFAQSPDTGPGRKRHMSCTEARGKHGNFHQQASSGGDSGSSESFSGRRTETVLLLAENNGRPIKKNSVTARLLQ